MRHRNVNTKKSILRHAERQLFRFAATKLAQIIIARPPPIKQLWATFEIPREFQERAAIARHGRKDTETFLWT